MGTTPNRSAGPIFANAVGEPLSLGSLVNRVILPTLRRCEVCGRAESDQGSRDHDYRRDRALPEWHGWHAARRGLGSNLYRLGVPEIVIQRILRYANVSTTSYIKTAADDVRNAVSRLENHIYESQSLTDTFGTLNTGQVESLVTIQ